MGYHELLKALEDEVERQIVQIEAETDETCRRIDTKVRRELAARREAALVAERRRLEVDAERAIGRARGEQARTLLVEQRRLLTEVRQEAERRLPVADAALAARLAEEIASEIAARPVELRVSPGTEAAFVAALAQRWPDGARRATVTAVDGMGGGVVAVLDGGRQLLDNSLPSRLDNAWQQLEGELAAVLFGEVTDGSRL